MGMRMNVFHFVTGLFSLTVSFLRTEGEFVGGTPCVK